MLLLLATAAWALFWTDPWLNSTCIEQTAPALFAAVNYRAKLTRTVEEALSAFPVLVQFLDLLDALQVVALSSGFPDRVEWKLTTSQSTRQVQHTKRSLEGWKFSPAAEPFGGPGALPSVKSASCWRDRMRRRGLNSHNICPRCDQEPETSDHLALGCVLARVVWQYALQRCNLEYLIAAADASLTNHKQYINIKE
jgi:hypothetical protein